MHTSHTKRTHRNGLLALSPLLFMAILFISLSFCFGGLSKVPLWLVFSATCIYALLALRGMPPQKRLRSFFHGATDKNLLLMVWIFILAGAFASSAKAMGAVDATVNLTLHLMPSNMILPGIFLAACLISLSIGTSVGTIVALVPIATELSDRIGMTLPLVVAAVVGGAFFGDNLSFISDTTVVATRTQGCRMSDKFRTNIRIALPAALLTFVIYLSLGWGNQSGVATAPIDLWRVLPYAVVLVTAIAGINVLWVLALGVVLTAGVGLWLHSFDVISFLDAALQGILGMAELIFISMLAGGLLATIRLGGGITYLIYHLTRRIHSTRSAELSIAALVSMTNLCTANNTVAILSVGYISRDVGRKFDVDPRKSASILDTFSCCIQGLIPYGAQLLMAGSFAGIASTAIIPYLFYPYLLGLAALLAILFRYPKFKPIQ